jgi:serine/threonine-protein kinase
MRCEICRSPIDPDKKICDRCASKYKGLVASDEPKGPAAERPSDGVVFPDSRYEGAGAKKPPVAPEIVRPIDSASDSGRPTPPPSGAVVDPRRSAFQLGADPSGDLSGTLLEGKYKLIEELGRGSMGTVYLADDIALKRKVAVKFLLPEMISAPESADRFRREAVAMAAIRDQNVAQIYTYGEQRRRPYFVMEYLPGQSVETLIDSHNESGVFIPLAEALDVLWQVVGGLGEIHRSGAVHRDIKPANIMITGDPKRAVILDFGLVRDVRVEDDMMTLAGTPAYIAPELVTGVEGADRSPLVDIYSAGATAYELITGTIPFSGDSWLEIIDKHVHETPLAPSERRPDLPPLFDEILLTALAKDPQDRYPSAEDFLKSLMLVDQQQALASTPPPTDARHSRSGAHHTPTGLRRRVRTPVGLSPYSSAGTLQPAVLVMDPDPEFRGLVSGTAGAAITGCRVLSAADSETAIELLTANKPLVALVDVSLPDIVGMEIAAVIHADESFKGTSIIGVASAEMAPDDEALSWLNLTRFVTKPIDPGRLADMLCTLCESAG